MEQEIYQLFRRPKEKVYRLDKYFECIKNLEGIRVKNRFKYLEEVVNRYEELLLTIYEKCKDEIIPKLYELENKEQQWYTFTRSLPKGDYYELIFSVPMLELEVNKNKLKPVNIYIEKLSFNKIELTDETIKEQPIIVGYFDTIGELVVLDGNTRTTSKDENNEEFIEGYYLSEEMFNNCYISEIYKTLYYIDRNIYLILSYISGNITKKDYIRECYPLIKDKGLINRIKGEVY